MARSRKPGLLRQLFRPAAQGAAENPLQDGQGFDGSKEGVPGEEFGGGGGLICDFGFTILDLRFTIILIRRVQEFVFFRIKQS